MAMAAEAFFAADRQVGDHGQLLAAVDRVCFELLSRAPGRFRRHDRHRRFRLPGAAGFASFDQGLAQGVAIMVGEQVEVRYAKQAALAAAGLGHAGRPDPGVGNDYLGVIGRHDVHGPRIDRRHLAISAIHFDPVARLIRVLDDYNDARDHAANVILEREGERQAHGRAKRHDVLNTGLDQKRSDHHDAEGPEHQSGDGRNPQDQEAPMCRRKRRKSP